MTPLSATPYVLLLTGTCGSGKSTISKLLANRTGWARVSEDEIWYEHFGKNRGLLGSDEYCHKRRYVHATIHDASRALLAGGKNVVIDATIHEAPPEAYKDLQEFWNAHGMAWKLRVLHPRLEIAISRDALRPTGRLGADRVTTLRAKFTGTIFLPEWFVDTSEDTPDQTVTRLLDDPTANVLHPGRHLRSE